MNDNSNDYTNLTDTTQKTFGAGVTVGTNEGSNNAIRQFQPGSRQAEYIIEQQFSGSWSVDFTLTNPWFLRSMFGKPTTTGEMRNDSTTNNFWEHLYDGQFPDTLVLVEQIENPDGTFDHRLLKGCVVSSISISVGVEDVVEISVDGAYADEEIWEDVDNTTGAPFSSYTQPNTDYRPMHFGNAKLYIDEDGDDVAEGSADYQGLIQDASLDLEGNVDIVYEIGTRIGVDFSPKALEPSLSYTRLIRDNDTTDQKAMYGSSSATAPEDPVITDGDVAARLTINNGKSGTEENFLQFKMSGTLADSFTKNNVGDPESDIEGDIERLVSSVKVLAGNDTEIAK